MTGHLATTWLRARAEDPRGWSLGSPSARLRAARLLGVAGLCAYNWWVVVLVSHGGVPSRTELFSDLSANGQPHAAAFQRLDVATGLVLALALLLHGPAVQLGRAAWRGMLVFCLGVAIGGVFPFACVSSASATCRALERHLELPAHHYLHMLAGALEFLAPTIALLLARRCSQAGSPENRVLRWLTPPLVFGYPLLALAYFTDHWGEAIEPVFFIVFTALVLLHLVGPPVAEETRSSPSRPERHWRWRLSAG